MERKNCYKCLVMSNCKQVPCPRTLSLRWNASVVLVITRRAECTARQSTPTRFLSLAMERSDRSNLLTSHTCFFDYFATLVMTKAKIATLRSRWQFTLRSRWQLVCTLATRDLSLLTPNKIFPRSLNVSLPRATFVAWWKQSTCQRWPRGTRPLAMTSCFSAYGAIYAVIAGVYKHDFDK